MADFTTYSVDIDTLQPDGRRGESPRSAFTKYNALLSGLNSFKGDIEDNYLPVENIVQTTGSSLTDVMSQDAVTAQLFAIAQDINNIKSYVNVQDFGVVGDGITDDTTALIDAINEANNSKRILYFPDLVIRITSNIVSSNYPIAWLGNNTKLVYDNNSHTREFVSLKVPVGSNNFIKGISFNANSQANIALQILSNVSSESEEEWPNFYGDEIEASGAYRKDQSFTGGDGILFNGGFNKISLNNVYVHDCFMATGAEVSGYQGIFGLTLASGTPNRVKHIFINNYHIENIWSEDSSYFADQDAIRIFQDQTVNDNSCFIKNGIIKNVSGRAIKIHSGTNTFIDGLFRILESTVVPQQGEYGTPDIDSQQCPSAISNCRFIYDGSFHSELIRNYTERDPAYRYGGAIISNISAKFENIAEIPVAISVRLAPSATEVDEKLVISNVNIDGQVGHFLKINDSTASSNYYIGISNCIAKIRLSAILNSTGLSNLINLNISNLQNIRTGNIPITENLSYKDLSTSRFTNCRGFTLNDLGNNPNPIRIGPEYNSFYLPSSVGVSDLSCIILLQDTSLVRSHITGEFILFRNSASSGNLSKLRLSIKRDSSSANFFGGTYSYEGPVTSAVKIITCSFAGKVRLGVQINSVESKNLISNGYFNGSYLGEDQLELVKPDEVTSISEFSFHSQGFDSKIEFGQPVKLPIYSTANIPDPVNYAGCVIYVTSGGAGLVYSNGIDWIKAKDGLTL